MRNKISLRGGGKFLKYFVILIILVVAGLIIKSAFSFRSPSDVAKSEDKLALKPAVSTKDINKDIAIKIKDQTGEEVDEITLHIDNIELRDEIIVQGQKASSVSGRTFLVVNMKLVNKMKQAVEVNTKDYLRLGVEGHNDEWLAPDIHNDPVLIQAISTKPTRVAFPVDETSRKFSLQVGEITGDKQKVELDLSQ